MRRKRAGERGGYTAAGRPPRGAARRKLGPLAGPAPPPTAGGATASGYRWMFSRSENRSVFASGESSSIGTM